MLVMRTIVAALLLAVPAYGLYSGQARNSGHRSLVHRSLVRRSNKATYFTPDEDACTGKTSSTKALIAAVSTDLYGNTSKKSKYCGQCAKVTGPSGTVVVRIVDACPTCESHSLDLTETAFKKIAPVKRGVVTIKWSWTACSGGSGSDDSETYSEDSNDDESTEDKGDSKGKSHGKGKSGDKGKGKGKGKPHGKNKPDDKEYKEDEDSKDDKDYKEDNED